MSCNTDIIKVGKKGHHVFSIENFAIRKSIKGKKITLSGIDDPADFILIPEQNLIVIIDGSGEYWGKTYSLDSLIYKKSIIKKTETIQELKIINYNNESRLLYFADNYTKKIYSYSIDSINLSNSNVLPTQVLSFKGKDFNYRPVIRQDDGAIIEPRTNRNGSHASQFDFYFRNGKFNFSAGSFPSYIGGYKLHEVNEIFLGAINISKKSKRIVKNYFTTDLIDLFDSTGRLIKRVQGPTNFDPSFTREIDGRIEYISFTKKSRFGYCGVPQYSKESFYFLYSGNYSSQEYSGNSILQFDSLLSPQSLYNLDVPIFTFKINGDKQILYGLSKMFRSGMILYDLN